MAAVGVFQAGPAGPDPSTQERDTARTGRRLRHLDHDRLALHHRDRRDSGLLDTRPARGPGGPGRGRLRHRRRHAHPDGPHRGGRTVLLKKAPQARDERAGRRRPGRHSTVVLKGDAGPHARPDRSPRPRDHRGLPHPADPDPGRPRLPGRRLNCAYSLLRAPRPARPLPAVQQRPRPPARPGRTRLRPTEDLADPAPGPLLNQPHRTHRRRHPHSSHLQKRRM